MKSYNTLRKKSYIGGNNKSEFGLFNDLSLSKHEYTHEQSLMF